MLAALSNEAVEQVAEVVKEVMAGTPDAARAEPFTWLTYVGVCMILVVGFGGLMLLLRHFSQTNREFTSSIKENNAHNATMQDRCHTTQVQTMKMATDAVAMAASSAHETKGLVAEVREMVGKVMERIS